MALAALLVSVPGMVLLFGRGGPRDAHGRRMFRLRPVWRLFGALLLALAGDQWRIDGVVVGGRRPALLAGGPPLYAFDRISGRYRDIDRERSEPRTVHALHGWPVPDLAALKRVFPNWLPFIDVEYGSAA